MRKQTRQDALFDCAVVSPCFRVCLCVREPLVCFAVMCLCSCEYNRITVIHAATLPRVITCNFKLNKEQQEAWLDRRDKVANLQLLEGKRNQSKNDTPLADWLGRLSEPDVVTFKRTHYFPDQQSLDFSAFMEFYEARRMLLREKLAEIFAVSLGGGGAKT